MKGAGFFYPPTILSNVKDSDECMQEEIFGPVLACVSYKTEKEVIDRANNVPYGLAGSVWTSDVKRWECAYSFD